MSSRTTDPSTNGADAESTTADDTVEPYLLLWPDLKIKHLIRWSNSSNADAFIVFIDDVCDLDWRHKGSLDLTCACEIWNEVSAQEPWVQNWPADLKLSAKRALGEAVARALEGAEDSALKALKYAKLFIARKSREVSRYWTLQACAGGTSFAFLVAVAAVAMRDVVKDSFGVTAFVLLLAGCSGALGSLLSIILRLGRVNLDARAERRLHYAEGLARVTAGCISGALVGGLIKIGLLLPVFSQTGALTTAVCCAAMIAGASERLVPSIIAKVEVDGDAVDQPEGGGAV